MKKFWKWLIAAKAPLATRGDLNDLTRELEDRRCKY